MEVSTPVSGRRSAVNGLMDRHGVPVFGLLSKPPQTLGVEHFDCRTTMDKPASKLARYFSYKQFQFVSLATERYLIGAAIADIRYLGSAFCYVYDISNNTLVETEWMKAPGIGYGMSPSPQNGQAFIGGRGARMAFAIENGQWHIEIETPEVEADLVLDAQGAGDALALCSPTGYNGWTYTQKHPALGASGTLKVHGEVESLDGALAGYDFSAGFMRRDTSWRWASIHTQTGEGPLGLNLAAGVNETGCTENAFWLGGIRHLLGPVHFAFSRSGDGPWHIYSDDGRVELEFTPLNKRCQKLNLWLLRSNFRQYMGHFSGRLTGGDGTQIEVNRALGLTEDHYARW